jgi:AcrR family transcriptional regulator
VSEETTEVPVPARRVRADAQRNLDALLEAAKAAFAETGVHTPVREIAKRAGVGTATLYRRFPQRADLISAVFKRELDGCAAAGAALAADHEPDEALELWMAQYADLLATKRGLAAALSSNDPAYEDLPACFQEPLLPTLAALLDAAAAAGQIRADIEAGELLQAVAGLCLPAAGGAAHAKRMVALLIDGLRYGAASAPRPTGRDRSKLSG